MAVQFITSGPSGTTFSAQRQDGDYIFLYTYKHSTTTRSWNSASWVKLQEWAPDATANENAQLWYIRWTPSLSFSTTITFSGLTTGFSAPGALFVLMRGLTAAPTIKSEIHYGGGASRPFVPAVFDQSITPGDMSMICCFSKGGQYVNWNAPSVPTLGYYTQRATAYTDQIFAFMQPKFSYSPGLTFPYLNASNTTNVLSMQVILPGTAQTVPTATTTGGTWWKWKAPRDGVLALDSLYSDPKSSDETVFLFLFEGDDNGGSLEMVRRYVWPRTNNNTPWTTAIATTLNAPVEAGKTYYIKATVDPTGAT